MSTEKSILAGARRLALEEGLELRLLSAREVMEARREAAGLAEGGRERALCSNACLVARALEREGSPVYNSGQAVLDALTVGQIEALADCWSEFNREENPSVMSPGKQVDALKKVWSTRRRSACSGVCSEHLGRCPGSSVSGR